MNGAPNGSFRIIFEGQDSTSDLNPRVSDESQPSMESIQEFTLQTSNFAPEFGQVIGGSIQLHGAFRHAISSMAAPMTIPPTRTLEPGSRSLTAATATCFAPNRQNDFGGTIGGPVWIPKVYNGHDRTFFFFSYEMYRKHQATDTFGTVPTASHARRGFQLHSDRQRHWVPTRLGGPSGERDLRPRTTREVNGATVTDPFPNNIIPTSRLDPVALKVQALIPFLPTRNVNNFEEKYITSKIQAIPTVKIDHNFNEKVHLSGLLLFAAHRQRQYSGRLPRSHHGAARTHLSAATLSALNYDHTISPRSCCIWARAITRYHNPDTAPPSITGYDVTRCRLEDSGWPRVPAYSPDWQQFLWRRQ